jgi:hypothetical protein
LPSNSPHAHMILREELVGSHVTTGGKTEFRGFRPSPLPLVHGVKTPSHSTVMGRASHERKWRSGS